MSIGMDNYLDKIRTIEATGRLGKDRIGKLPVGAPEFPPEATNPAPVLLKAGLASLGLKIPLVPTPVFLRGRGRVSIIGDVLDVVATNRNQPYDLGRPKSSHRTCCPGAPVVTGQDRPLEVQTID